MNQQEINKLIESEEDYIYLKKYDFSLKKLLERYPDGCPNRIIAQALLMSEDDIEELYEQIVEKLKQRML